MVHQASRLFSLASVGPHGSAIPDAVISVHLDICSSKHDILSMLPMCEKDLNQAVPLHLTFAHLILPLSR